ncbi:hypothetical protein A9K55_002675 [Cordyceps militaris]|uniref:Arylsulfotransferase n=1 Tax=Cordyceps militaris TaxID=73501 RepID=A0A2H4S852_CORMI|nr:hypothetical protein A9K55_002675 [Cordyceps militaris]
MGTATRILQFALLAVGVSATLKSECNSLAASGRRSRLSDLLNPRPPSQYKTFCGPTPPELDTWHSERPCDDGLLFVAPGERIGGAADHQANVEGPAIFRTNGDLVWTQSGWGQTRDLKVQTAGNRSYMTFWHDENSRHDGGGSFVVLDQTYEMVRELRPIGDISSRPVELKLTDDGTAIMVMHSVTQIHTPFGGLQSGWIDDAIIQEVDLMSNELISEWRASDHFDATVSQAGIQNRGGTPETAFDFFHATGIDLDHNGNYVISSRNMCNAAALRRSDGKVLWVLGGSLNSFEDGSAGQATAMIASQGVQWHGDSTLLLLDGGHVAKVEGRPGRRSNARMIHLDTTTNTAAVVRIYSTPVAVASSRSQGSLQRLPSGHVFVGWGERDPSAAAYTEYSAQGETLCAARFPGAPSRVSARFRMTPRPPRVGGRVVSKYAWTGTPAAPPVVVVRPQESALYVSWNGDTQTTTWLLRSNNTERRDGSLGARRVVERTGFETRIPIPRDVGEVIEVIGVDDRGVVLVRSALIWSEGASGTWSTQQQRVQDLAVKDEGGGGVSPPLPPLPSWWKQSVLLGEHGRLVLPGLGLSVAVFVWRRWIGRRRWRMLRKGRSRDHQREMAPKGEKSVA